MESEKFKSGDLVQLKSGGPTMTIRRYDSTRHNWYCDWFDINGEHKMQTFRGDQLETVNAVKG
ncbi:YodC family protein [Kaistella antarctica]|uniref:Uncharacterized small protein n=1 Tax=Kaistella antarctica TaxID=266748 RepID=A0A3S4W1F0_9FLAO|nr:DUF2158 domain-containing protein [Kaistella antarctica]KEY19823.1 hypothetical protein HY04_00920 [Kaistella antarctica]SEV97240.1 Uncharacterized conserved protein YodC, DUF2158 family [Kaistella antarctica]VEH96396.1 Uncharacterized small protein [Kaistella antarctica]